MTGGSEKKEGRGVGPVQQREAKCVISDKAVAIVVLQFKRH
jgi:hypothetical protein